MQQTLDKAFIHIHPTIEHMENVIPWVLIIAMFAGLVEDQTVMIGSSFLRIQIMK